jgi:hypothetical protein
MQLVYVIVAVIGAIIAYTKLPMPYKWIGAIIMLAVAFYFAWPLVTTGYAPTSTWIPGGFE